MAFYPFAPELSQKLRKAKLTAAEWRFWAYLTELDPWGDQYRDIDPLTIMTECGMSKPTYYRAKAKFQELGLFDFQEEKVSFRNLNGAAERNQSQKLNSQSQKLNSQSQKLNSQSQKLNSQSQKLNSQSQKRENQPPEPAPSATSSAPQTIQTFTDFLQTLSEGERAGFQDFCRKETENYPKPIINLGDYLASRDSNGQPRYLDFWERFRAGAAPRAGAADAEQAWKEAIAYAARYNRYDEGTWLKSLPISPEMKNAIGACGGLMRLGEANSSELFTLKSTFKQAFRQPNQPINHQERAYAVPALR